MAGEIFISYRRADEPHARLLYNRLKEHGVDAWYDAQVGAGEDWRTATAKALQHARIFVLLFSRAAAASDDITKELAAATFSKKLIVPVRLEDIQPEGAFLYELAGRNWINAFDETEAKIGELARSLAALVKSGKEDPALLPFDRHAGEAGRSGATAKPKGSSARLIGLLAGGAVVAIGVAALAMMVLGGKPGDTKARDGRRIAFFGFESAQDDPAMRALALAATDKLFEGLNAERLDVVARSETAGTQSDARFARSQEVGAMFALSGQVRSDGAADSISVRLEEVANRAVLMEEVIEERGARRPYATARAATLVATVLRCVERYTNELAAPDVETLGLVTTVCRSTSVGQSPNFGTWRELVARHPESRQIQAGFVSTMQPYRGSFPEPMQAAVLEAAEAAFARLEASGPPDALSKLAAYDLARWRSEPLTVQEALLRAGLQMAPDSGWLNYWYANLLMSAGHVADSNPYVRALYGDDPLHPTYALMAGRHTAFVGGGPSADGAFRTAAATTATRTYWGYWMLASLFSGAGDPEEVATLAPPGVSPSAIDCFLRFRELTSSEAAIRTRARAAVDSCAAESLTDLTPFVAFSMMAGAGDHDRALNLADAAGVALFQGNLPALFDKATPGLRAHPRFEAVAEKLLLMDYWRTTKRLPDFCHTETAPVCDTLRAAGAT